MAARRRIQVDHRTSTMTTEALLCRSFGHTYVPTPVPAPEKREWAKLGQRLTMLQCSRGCGRWRRVITDYSTAELITETSGYTDPGGYLVQEDGGRLPRQSARAAFFATAGDD